jgi:stage II sporulation protein D
LSASGSDYIVSGKGWGHNVGMSQWGARGMAEQGYTFDEILRYYYTGVDITGDY